MFERAGARPLIDFAGVQSRLGGEPTRVLVLGTRHLSGLPEDQFDPAHLSLLLDRLESFAPDIIAIEAIGGRTCDLLRRYAGLYDGAGNRYCRDPEPALQALGMSAPEAALAVEETLQAWPESPTAADRRRFAALLYGAGEPWSAGLQWAQLTEAERQAEDGVSASLRETLDAMQDSRNENNLIGIALGRRLGLRLLAAMDDHSADFVYGRSPESLGPVIQAVWGREHPLEQAMDAAQQDHLGSPEKVLEGYRFQNSAAVQRFAIEKDFGAAAAESAEGAVARQYVAWWQIRGLRMAANVVEAVANDPGARVLVVVGASHKPYFEAYLDQMHDVELVSADAVLADPP